MVTDRRLHRTHRPRDNDDVASDGSDLEAQQPTAVVSSSAQVEASEPAPRPSPPAFIPPERVDRYVLGELLGAGGLGSVYEAWDPKLERRVAVKLIRRRAELRGAERFVREAQALAQLSHPNVVAIYGVGTCEDGTVYVVMEHVDGWTLRRWAASEQPNVERLLCNFIEAGRGLAAAHAVGMVHRDFKPDNVMVDRDGRVRVLDFGLALMGGRRTELSYDEPAAGSEDPWRDVSFDDRLTEVGVVMGTPPYMAPEQHAGKAVGPASDQYAFCASMLRELRGGARIFEGETLEQVAEAKARRRIRPASSDDPTPAWLTKVLLRGLHPKAEERWPSMDALLDALQPKPKRGRWVVGGVVVVVLAWVSWSAAGPRRPLDCSLGADALARVWTDDARETAASTVLAELGSRGPGVASRLNERLDSDVQIWREGFIATCSARAERQLKDAAFERRLTCLRRRISEREQLLAGLETRIARLSESLVRLEAVESCLDDDALAQDAAQRPMPRDRERRIQVEVIRGQLSNALDMARAADFEAIDALMGEIVPAVMELEFDPLVAEMLHTQASIASERGDPAAALVLFEDALASAQSCDHDTLAALTAVDMVFLYTRRLRQPEEAERQLAQARSLVMRAGSTEPLRRKLAHVAMSFYASRQRFDEALEASRDAMPKHPPESAAERYQYSISLNNLALLHSRRGDYTKAESLLLEALALREEALGSDHPKLGATHLNIANSMARSGKYSSAEPHLTRAIELLSDFRDDDVALARPLITRGVVRKKQGRYDEAREDYEHALTLVRIAGRSDMEAMVLANIGNVDKHSGDLDAALKHHMEALAIREADLGAKDIAVAMSYGDIGSLYRRMERYEDAWSQYDRELAIYEDALGLDNPKVVATRQRRANLALDEGDHVRVEKELVEAMRIIETHDVRDTAAAATYVCQGALDLERGRPEASVSAYEEAIERFTSTSGNPGSVGEARFGLARALWEAGEHGNARDALSRARVELREGGASVAKELEELELVASEWSGRMPTDTSSPSTPLEDPTEG